MYGIFYLEDQDDDVVFPDADKHEPSYTKCAEGFAITHDIKAQIIETIAVFKTENKVGPTSSSSNDADASGETTYDETSHHDGAGATTWENKSSEILKVELRRQGEKLSGKVGELRERLVAPGKLLAARV
jgi:hypothetical protein